MLIVQSDLFAGHPSVSVLLVSSEIVDAPLIRIEIQPSERNGLLDPSQILADKIFTVKREKVGSVIGQIEDEVMVSVNRAMLVFWGLA